MDCQQKAAITHPFCFIGSSNLNIVASFTTALYACEEILDIIKNVHEI